MNVCSSLACKGHIFVNNEGENTIQVIDVRERPGRRDLPSRRCQSLVDIFGSVAQITIGRVGRFGP